MELIMATYYLLSFSDPDALQAAASNFGPALQNTIIEKDDEIKFFPIKDGSPVTTPENNSPKAVPIEASGLILGYVVGKYYDDCAVGFHSLPAGVPPKSFACIVSNSGIEELDRLNGNDVARMLTQFKAGGAKSKAGSLHIRPVFFNSTNTTFPLHILKANPVASYDRNKIREVPGFGFALEEGYVSPHMA